MKDETRNKIVRLLHGLIIVLIAIQPLIDMDYLFYEFLDSFGLPRFSTVLRFLILPALVILSFVLREKKNLLTVFLHAPADYRAEKVMAEQSIDSRTLAEKSVKKHDKARADYYNFFTHKKWGDSSSYMLSIDVSTLPADVIADAIAHFAQLLQDN